MKQQLTIAVDIDDVLSKTVEAFITFSNERWGHTLTTDDYQEAWAEVWNVTIKEAEKRGIEYHDSGAVGRYRPHDSAFDVLKKLSKKYRLIAATSRRKVLMPETEAWMAQHFPGIFSELHYAGMWDRTQNDFDIKRALSNTKTELLQQIGANYLIDDQLKHCVSAHQAGITAILFGEYGWNKNLPEGSEGIIRARDWNEVAEYFNV